MNDRTCIVTRRAGDADALLRFVAGPDGSIVPDLKRKLPGRGCWVTAERTYVDEAARKKLFARALKREVAVPEDLGAMVDRLFAQSALGAIGLARKAGQVALGAAKVEAKVRSGEAVGVLHADEAAEDGVRKIAQARRATVHLGGPDIPAHKLFREAELGLALGATNVIHAALLAGEAGKAALKRVVALDRYRGNAPDITKTAADPRTNETAAEDTE
ncbi:MAG: RNA-binding protein [Rhizobiaceae bacterium]|nr:RNA-binding protein [Rhizobiaceae bacterium]